MERRGEERKGGERRGEEMEFLVVAGTAGGGGGRGGQADHRAGEGESESGGS